MTFLDKLNDIATTAGQKAGDAIELGRLNLRITAEEKKMADATALLGDCVLRDLDEGVNYESPDLLEVYALIQSSRDTVNEIRREIAAISGEVLCDDCDAMNIAGSNFCRHCGVKLPEQNLGAAVLMVEFVCPQCGIPVDEDENYCHVCGCKQKGDEAAPEDKTDE